MCGEPVWIKADQMAEALVALRSSAAVPAQRVVPLRPLSLGNEVADSTLSKLVSLLGNLPGSLATHAGAAADEVGKAAVRVIEIDQRGGK